MDAQSGAEGRPRRPSETQLGVPGGANGGPRGPNGGPRGAKGFPKGATRGQKGSQKAYMSENANIPKTLKNLRIIKVF